MKWDTYQTKKITEKYVYRYMTIEKLIHFLTSNSIYLSRLDKFEDHLENISPYDINELKIKITKKPDNANPEISDETWDEIIKNGIDSFKNIQSELISEQKKRFVSCWILSDVESFAMWDIYGKSGFVVRFEQTYFQNLIRNSINLQVEPTNQIDLLVAGEVQYQNFDEMLTKEKQSLLKYSVFRKHLSFKHESEYRIVGFMNEEINTSGLQFKIPNIEGLDFDIFANPRLNKFQLNIYQNIISKYSPKHELKESALKSWLDFRDTVY